MAKKMPENKKHHPHACRYYLVTGDLCIHCTRAMKEPLKPAITVNEMAVLLSNAVYFTAVKFCERTEDAGLTWGNGHHMAQIIAGFAKREIISRSTEWALRTARKMMKRGHRNG